MNERPPRSVGSVPQAWNQGGISVRVAEAVFEDLEDDSNGNIADTGMPHDVGDEIEDDGDLVRVEGPIEHPANAKGIGDEPSPVDFLLLEYQGDVLAKNDFHFFALFVRSGEHAGLAFGGCSRPEVVAIGLCGGKRSNSFPDTACKTSTEDAPESWSNSSGDNEDDTEDLSTGNGDRCGSSVLRPKMVSEDVGNNEESGLKHEGKRLDEESKDPGEVAVKGTGRPVSTRAKVGRVQVHDCISFEGLLGEYGKEGDEE